VTNVYSPTGKLAGFKWDFGDGATAGGEKVTHRYARRGQHIVTVTAADAAGATVEKQTPLYVGYKPEDGLVCRLLMDGAMKQRLKSWVWRGGWEKLDYALIPDASGHGNTGFLTGGKWAQDEARGAVLELGGKGERVVLCNTPDINTAAKYQDRTVSLWFKPTATQGRQVLYEEGGPGAGVNMYLDGGALYAGVWNRQVWPGTWLKREGIQPGQWRHVAVVLREAKEKPEPDHVLMFVDGAQAASGEAALIGPHYSDICVGWAGSTLYHDGKTVERADAFAGRIDDVMVFNRALSAPDIKKLAGAE